VRPFWKIPFGRFSANLRITYGTTNKNLDGKVYFWIIPWWTIIAAILLIILIIFTIFRRRRRKKKVASSPPNENLTNPPKSNDSPPLKIISQKTDSEKKIIRF
jgi:flagellar biosynthesis/type III secretory pathway M-ring protein FliF/YscJ